MKAGDVCQITDEYIKVEGDPSLKGQVFEVIAISNDSAIIHHEAGFKLHLPAYAIKKVK